MKTVVLVSQKGGAGKSTLAINLAVAATQARKNAMLVDLDPQGTTEAWYQDRDDEKLKVVSADPNQLAEIQRRARSAKIDWLIVDTPGRDEPGTATAIKRSDFCLLPCRPSPSDMKAIPPTVATIQRLNKPFAFALTQTPPRGPRIREAQVGLAMLGTVAPTHIVARTAFQDAQGVGQGVLEFEPKGKAAGEIRSFWSWLNRHLRKLHG